MALAGRGGAVAPELARADRGERGRRKRPAGALLRSLRPRGGRRAAKAQRARTVGGGARLAGALAAGEGARAAGAAGASCFAAVRAAGSVA